MRKIFREDAIHIINEESSTFMMEKKEAIRLANEILAYYQEPTLNNALNKLVHKKSLESSEEDQELFRKIEDVIKSHISK